MPLISLAAALFATLAGFNPLAEPPAAQSGDGSTGSGCGGRVHCEVALIEAAPDCLPGRDWSAKAEDNICGLRDLAQVSSPVVIDFQACLDATPEMKKIKAEKIDPKSPDGIRLTTEATNRVTQACEAVQKANGYCSVWKAIKHKDGRAVTDISSQVTAQF
ncbi:MAG: hypothetical protein JNN27_07185 [Planctomycetes bacterium]|nr:hypothetical protein [Planctomycetota bacterium]